jgi:putative ABC transport system ATP-binding protein
MSVILEAQALSRRVDVRILVDDISFQVHDGEVFGITGPSGSGKSSLLRLLNRLDEPTSGTVLLRGADYRGLPARELRRKVGMVTQRAFLFPGTVGDNVDFGPRQHKEPLCADAIEVLLSRVGLPGYANRDVTNLSGGEAQRVSLARALANSPHVLLLDEPTSALDEESKREIEALIRRLVSDTKLTCIIVTHDLAQAARLASQVMILESGRAVRIGPVSEVLRASTTFQ